jgi:ABC-type protease/lipase transport system fused ATPase/permease subunit
LLPLIDAPWVPVFLVIVYLIHPWLGHVALVGAAVLFVAALLNNKLTAARQARANVAAAMAFGRAESALRNADTITAMGMLPELIRQWGGVTDEAVVAQSGVARTSAILMAASKAFRLALQVGVLGIGAYLVILQDITAGGMIASSIIMSRALAPV